MRKLLMDFAIEHGYIRDEGKVEVAALVLLLITPLARSTATPESGVYSHQLVQSSCEGRDFIVCYITIDPGRQYWLALARQHSGRSDQAGRTDPLRR